jgi:mannose-1-phosphate guanylyltransferase
MYNRDNFYAVIMAGGKGERFWPQSRIKKPKQLLNILGEKTLIEESVIRLRPIISEKNIIIITNKLYVEQIKKLFPNIPEDNIVGEPVGKDTAACIALAAALATSKSGKESNPVLAVLPADHIIKKTESFCKVLEESAEIASNSDKIITIGITPTEPSTGYGYIKYGEKYESVNFPTHFYCVEKFFEKPDYETAVGFLKEGNFKWNSGMFLFSFKTIFDAFHKYLPEMANGINCMLQGASENNFENAVCDFFEICPKISIDYAVMEKADNILVAESTFEWDDVGSWTALKKHLQTDKNDNAVLGKFLQLKTNNCIVSTSSDHLVATIGVQNLIIVHTDDATLVCKEEDAQNIKELVHILSENSETKEYL